MPGHLTTLDAANASQLPIHERLLDKLADILLASDDILDIVATSERLPSDAARVVEEKIRTVYNQVNELMKTISD